MHKLMPTIEFRISDFAPNEKVYNFVSQLVHSAMVRMKLTHTDVQKMVIADTDHYGSTIMELSPTDGHTDDGILQGLGKTVPQIENGRCVGNKLVIHASIIDALAAPASNISTGREEALRYAFFHELGHCADHRHRQIHKPVRTYANTRSFALRCAEANAATLTDEYAACFLSSSFLSPAGFSFMADFTVETLRKYLSAVAEKRNQYRFGLLDIREVRGTALETIWRGLIEYAKLFAYLHGNPALL